MKETRFLSRNVKQRFADLINFATLLYMWRLTLFPIHYIAEHTMKTPATLLSALIALNACVLSCKASTATDSVIHFQSVPPATTLDRFARFEFNAVGADRFVCHLDGVRLTACSSPLVLMPRKAGDVVLAVGTHSLRVQAMINGKLSAPHNVNWTIVSVLDQARSKSSMVNDAIASSNSIPPDYFGVGSARGNATFLKGIARFKCLESHTAYDDPIVFPGMPGHAHLHSFWGNQLADAASTSESLFTSGSASCQGDSLNRSSYWVPALMAPTYDSSGARSGWQPVLKDADPRAIARGLFHETYYYSAVVTDVSKIAAPPVGLRIIAGNAAASATAPADDYVLGDPNYIAHWYCAKRRANPGRQQHYDNHVPECPITFDPSGRPNSLAHYVIRFPSCWDGAHLDSDNHKSHMAYPVFKSRADGTIDRSIIQCPADHPVAIPEVSYHYSFAVTRANADPATQTSRGWRLASDNYPAGKNIDGKFAYGGHSLHGDWFNAWHPEVIQAFIDGCLKQNKDCTEGQLGSPNNDGVYYELGKASRAKEASYPVLPNVDLSGMPVGMKMRH